MALALAVVGIIIGIATDRQTERFENEQDLAEAARVSEFVSDHYARSTAGLKPVRNWTRSWSRPPPSPALRITMFDAQGNILAYSHDPYPSTFLELEAGPVRQKLVDEGWEGETDVWFDQEIFPVLYEGEVVGSFAGPGI